MTENNMPQQDQQSSVPQQAPQQQAAPQQQVPQQTAPAPAIAEHEPAKSSSVEKVQTLLANKGLLIGSVLVIIALVVGVSVMFSFNAVDQYQGMLKKIEQDTAELTAN